MPFSRRKKPLDPFTKREKIQVHSDTSDKADSSTINDGPSISQNDLVVKVDIQHPGELVPILESCTRKALWLRKDLSSATHAMPKYHTERAYLACTLLIT